MKELENVPKDEVPAVVKQAIRDGYTTITVKKQQNGNWIITMGN